MMLSVIVGSLVATVLMAEQVSAHGLVFSPPARTYYCGYITKPDQVLYNLNPTYPTCIETFNNTQITSQASGGNQGYNFMSFATHNQGFLAVGPTKYVCSMESDFSAFAGNITYQDLSINWPTSTISSGPYSFVWDTRWGNHYGDTEEFVYWITKPDFVYTVGMNLTWDHFDTTPFCHLPYTYGVANDYVSIDSTLTVFTTNCTIPARTGRHIIKAEWGRTPPTNERFHSCIDVVINGGTGTTTTTTSKAPTTTTTTTTTKAPTTTTTTTTTTTKASTTTTTTTTTTTRTTTTTTTTRTTTTTASPSPTGTCAALYQQCGGIGWTGVTCCTSSTCTVLNSYYYQCL